MLLLQYSPLKNVSHPPPQATKDNPPSLGPFRRPMCNFTIDCTKSKDDKNPISQMPRSVTNPAKQKKKTQKKNPISSSKHSSTKRQNNLKIYFILKQKSIFR